MTREPIVLITGANGEVGHGLIEYLSAQPHVPEIVTLDLMPQDERLLPRVKKAFVGNILDDDLLKQIHQDYEIDTIFHLAALLSTAAEKNPEFAHAVNVQGTVNLLHMAIQESETRGKSVKFIYPSSIAAHGIPDLKTKAAAGAVREDDFLMPTTMYGCNKLYCEHMGRYYSNHYKQLDENITASIDFRCVRFPGLISAFTVPSGGTSDYGPEMIHAAAQGHPYECFVREDTIIPFMAMPDAIKALIQLAEVPRENLSREVYNVTAFSLTAAEFAAHIQAAFPDADVTYAPHSGRQAIVDTWPAELDDSQARKDWGWQPDYGLERAFNEYLFPNIRERYAQAIT
jgi:nucleoside-diphosphate-sugar epimerase